MKIKRIIDITRKIHNGMTVWPEDSGVEIKRNSSIEEGSVANVSQMKLSLHTGTHLDAPLHFIDKAGDVDSLELYRYIGFVKVFDMKVEKFITVAEVEKLPIEAGDTVFFKTAGSSLSLEEPFFEDYVYLDLDAANYLVEKKVKAVGIDYLSVGGYRAANQKIHKAFLSAGIGVIEGLDLKNAEEGVYFYSCLPLRIDNGDGSPVRAVLLEFEE